jgi:hypothetical protein
MHETSNFEPPRRVGTLFQAAVIIVLATSIAWLFFQAIQADLGPTFLFYLLVAVLLAIPLPVLLYRLYSLQRASYILERDGIHLQWGLRTVDIPMPDVLWVHLNEDLDHPLAMPLLRWPGSVVGVRRDRELGTIEFMCSETRRMMLIATPERVFAISPGDRNAFLRAFQKQTELGSLTPVHAHSVYPTFLLAEIWTSTPARILLGLGIVLSVTLFIWVSQAVSTHPELSLGFQPGGIPLPPVASVQLFLLPVINVTIFLVNLITAIFFYRRNENHPLTYLLWGSSVVTGSLFLLAVYFILQTG